MPERIDMEHGLVSVIVPVFNRPRQLAECAASVLEQDYSPVELLIVDDGSTDETPVVARSLAQSHPAIVKVLRQENAGPGAARELGRRHARGEFIQYLDSDDVLLPGKFSAQVRALREDPGAGVAYGQTFLRSASGLLEAAPHKRTGEVMATMFPAFLLGRWWETATPLYRRSVTDRAGAWTNLRLEEDWEYDCRVASLGIRLAYVAQPVSEHRDHAGTRLSRGEGLDPSRMRDRARSHELMLDHARRAGIGADAAEMQHFARELFLLSRQCGAAGLALESKRLFNLARSASTAQRARGADFRLYRLGAMLLGWVRAGRASLWLDAMRGARSESSPHG